MTRETVASLAEMVGGTLEGAGDRVITGVADVRAAGPEHLGFIRDLSFAPLAKESKAGALLVPEPFETAADQIVVADPHGCFAKVARHFHPVPVVTEHQVHETAVVHPDAHLEEPVSLGPHVSVGAGCRIGRGSRLHAGVCIGADVTLGESCTLFPRVVVYDRCTMGDRVIIHAGAVIGADGFGYVIEKSGVRNKFPQLGTVEIGDDVEIGANTTIDRGALEATTIGNGTKIDNLCQIAHNIRIGSNTTISAMTAFAGGAQIGDRVILAGHIIGGNYRIVDDVIIGGNSVVDGDVTEPGMYAGYPLLPRREHARQLILSGRLPALAADLKELGKRVARLEEE